jgi:hypothetical protein
MAAAFLFCIAGQERESDTPALPPHSAPARPPRAAEPHTYIHRSVLHSQCGAVLFMLADRSTALHGRTANSLLSHGSRILWTPAGVHTTYVAQPMGRLAVQPGQRQSLQQRQKKRCLRQQLPQEGLQQQQQRNLCNSNALQMGLK